MPTTIDQAFANGLATGHNEALDMVSAIIQQISALTPAVHVTADALIKSVRHAVSAEWSALDVVVVPLPGGNGWTVYPDRHAADAATA